MDSNNKDLSIGRSIGLVTFGMIIGASLFALVSFIYLSNIKIKPEVTMSKFEGFTSKACAKLCHEKIDFKWMQCPITMDVLVDPMSTKFGHTYEKSMITDWLKTSNTDPLTRQKLTQQDLTPNFALKQAIEQFSNFEVAIKK